MEFFKVWTKHHFYYIRYVSVYIQPRYLYLIFRSVSANNINWFILHFVRLPFWKWCGFSTHLDTTVQASDVKAMTPGGD